MSKKAILILENIRSAQNVGAIFRTADAFCVEHIICVGITPHPARPNDTRPPHIQDRAEKLIAKTALGAEKTIPFSYVPSTENAITDLKRRGYSVYALEQDSSSQNLAAFEPQNAFALVLGTEVSGIPESTLNACDATLEIPMHGQKESLNVSVAAGIALYQLLSERY